MSLMAGARAPRDLIVVPRRDLSLEFANTLAWRGSTPSESLHSFQDLLAWLAAAKALPARGVAELHRWFDARRPEAAAVFGEAIEIREALYRVFDSIAQASAPAGEDLRLLNRALNQAAPRANLDRKDRDFGWRIKVNPSTAGLLTPVLWSAADLLVGPDRARVRRCANDRCLWLFLDDSRNRTRRWCSMQACGNRAKAHRHYLRQKRK